MNSRKSHHGPLLAPLIILAALIGAFMVNAPGTAKAAGADEGTKAEEAISVEIGKAKEVHLSKSPDVIILGNPAIADVVVEDNGQIFLLGREPGETNMMIFDKAGRTILSAAVVVGPIKKRRVTIDRGPESFTLSCNPRCVPVANPQGTGAVPATTPGEQAGAQEGSEAGGINPADLASALSGLLGNQPAPQ